MNAHTFNTPSPTCPVCHRTDAIKPHKLLRGLITCQHCRQRLVVSWSGHYVRDPFTLKQLLTEQRLRQQSHPLARFWRDCKSFGHPLLVMVLSGAVFFGTALVLLQSAPSGEPSLSRPTLLDYKE